MSNSTSAKPSDMALSKPCLRRAAKAKRAEMFDADCALDIVRYWPERFEGARIGAYYPIQSEISPLPLVDALREKGHEICLPRIIGPKQGLLFYNWGADDDLESGPYGTQQPRVTASPVHPDVVLIPMLAFTRAGGRLGYGGGYYDRTLANLRARGEVFACGMAFAGQEVDTLPQGEFDQGLDGILTEQGFILCPPISL